MERYRERKANVTHEVTVQTLDVRDQTLDVRDKDNSIRQTSLAGGGAEALFLLWNQVTVGKLPAAQKLTKARIAKCRERLKERPLPEWGKVISRVAASAFCLGGGGQGWKATFDWLIHNEDNSVKVMEGKYDGKSNDGDGAAPVPGKYAHLSGV